MRRDRAGASKTVTMNLISGMVSGSSKYLWLKAMGPIEISLELGPATQGLLAGADYNSSSWTVTNPQALALW